MNLLDETHRGFIKVYGGAAAGIFSNVVGIPMDRFRVCVAQDLSREDSIRAHFDRSASRLRNSPFCAYSGGAARCSQKGFAAGLNLFTPAEYRDEHPFLAAAAVGFARGGRVLLPRDLSSSR